MNVFIVRHGIAMELGEQGCIRDADRRLSDEVSMVCCQMSHGAVVRQL